MFMGYDLKGINVIKNLKMIIMCINEDLTKTKGYTTSKHSDKFIRWITDLYKNNKAFQEFIN